jgi:hypothetical protein
VRKMMIYGEIYTKVDRQEDGDTCWDIYANISGPMYVKA